MEGNPVMASITIRNLDDDAKTQLRVRASVNGRSLEEETHATLRETDPTNLAQAIPAHFCQTNTLSDKRAGALL